MFSVIAGVVLAVAVAIFARFAGFDRERVFYPVVLIVIGSYYDLFSIIGGGEGLIVETIGFVLFAAMATIGFRTSLWLVVGGLAGHGVFDAFHQAFVENPGVPVWWPSWCAAYDIAAATCLAVLIMTGSISAPATRPA